MKFRRAHAESRSAAAQQQSAALSEAKWKNVLDALPLGVVVSDAEANPVAMNSTFEELRPDYQRFALLQAAVGRVAAGSTDGEGACEAVDFPGAEQSSFIVTGQPLPGGETVTVIEDVSERKQVEALRRDFVINVGHELRTPVGAIVVLAESLAGERDPDVAHEMRQHILQEANRAAALIDDLLDLSKVQTVEKNTGALLESFGLRALLADVVDEAAPSAMGAKIAVELDAPSPDVQLRGRRDELVTAVGNLVTNAVKYSEPDSVVRVEAEIDMGQLCLIRVIDHGIGIPVQDQDRVFERFYRVDRSRVRSTGGSGLGLAIVRHIAMNHGGAVTLDSREGEGSTFTLTIPLDGGTS